MSHADFFMPLYIGRYLGDTGHLTTLQHGAYMLALMHYWCKGPLPDDDTQLAAITRLDLRTWRKLVAPAVRPFFSLIDGRLHQKRADAELVKANEISEKRRAAAFVKHGKPPANAPPHAGANAPPNGHAEAGASAQQVQPTVPINQYQVTSTEVKEDININPLPLNGLVGSRAREERGPNAWETDLGIEPPRRDDSEPVSADPRVVALAKRTAKAMEMRIPYGEVRTAEAQTEAILAQPQAVGADVAMGLKWQPAEPALTPQQQAAAAERDASPEQIEKARRAFAARARAYA